MNIMLLVGMFMVSTMQPMIMITMMIMIILMYSYIIYMSMVGYWFSYMLVMVMLSGVLVVFTYMVSLVPNESFENYNLLYMLMFIVFSVMGYNYIYNEDMSLVSFSVWDSWFGMLNLFMVTFLFTMMLMVVWFSYINEGAVRIS